MATPRSVTYNGVTLDPQGGFTITWTGRVAQVSCGFHIQDDTAANFRTELAAAIAALQADDKDFAVSWEGASILAYAVSDNTALRIRTRIVTPDETALLQRSWRLTWLAEIELPGQAWRGDTAQTGFTEGRIKLDLDQTNRPVYTFTGRYAGEPGGTARNAVFLYQDATAGIAKLIEDWLDANAVKGDKDTYSITVLPYDADWSGHSDATTWEGNSLNFTAQARYELIPSKADDTLTVNYTVEQMEISSQRITDWGRPSNLPAPYRHNIRTVVKVDHDLQQYDDLSLLYDTEIRPYIEAHVEDVLSGGVVVTQSSNQYVLLHDSVDFNTAQNIVSVNWIAQKSPIPGWLTCSVDADYMEDERKAYTRMGTGRDHDYTVYSPGVSLRCTETIMGEYVSDSPVTYEQAKTLMPPIGGNWSLDMTRVPKKRAETKFFGNIRAYKYQLTIVRTYTYVASGGLSSVVVGLGDSGQREPGEL